MDKKELQELGLHKIEVNPSYKNYKGSGADSNAICEVSAKQTLLFDGAFTYIQHRVSHEEIDLALKEIMRRARCAKVAVHGS